MAEEENTKLRVYLLVAALMIVGLIWFIADGKKEESYAPCSRDFIAKYGDQDCREQQQYNQQEEDYKDCGYKPTC